MKTLSTLTRQVLMLCIMSVLVQLQFTSTGFAQAYAMDTVIIGPGPLYLISDSAGDTSVICDNSATIELPVDSVDWLLNTLRDQGVVEVFDCNGRQVKLYSSLPRLVHDNPDLRFRIIREKICVKL